MLFNSTREVAGDADIKRPIATTREDIHARPLLKRHGASPWVPAFAGKTTLEPLYLKNSTFASRNHRKFAGPAESGPLIAKTAISNFSPGWTILSPSTRRFGMLKPWMQDGLGRPAARGSSPL